MSSANVDVSELRQFGKDLEKVPVRAADEVDKVLFKGAGTIRDTLRAQARGHARFPAFPAAITFTNSGSLTYDIGPDKDIGVGALGNVLYFGNATSGPTLPDPQGALDAETPSLERYIAEALAKAFDV